jgi:thioesterase domain-containing protein
LFARVSGNAQRVILPINDSALAKNTALPAFYCVHDVTGGALNDYVALAQRLDGAVRFYGIQAPLKRMLDPEFSRSIETIADAYVEAVERFQPQGPLFVGGYCAGAMIALEMAQRLRTRGREVVWLVAMDAVPENVPARLHAWHPLYWWSLARNLPGWLRHGGLSKRKDSNPLWRRLSSNAVALGRIARGRRPTERLNGGHYIDEVMSLARFPLDQRRFIQCLYESCFAYRPSQYTAPVAVYEAQVTPLFHLPQIGGRWKQIAPHCSVVGVATSHLGMLQEPHVAALAADLRARILSNV